MSVNLKFSTKRIFWVIGLIALAILAYWYSQSSSLFPKALNPQINQSLAEKAQKAGYKIAYNGNQNDTTGRAILAEGKRSEELFPESFYWTKEANVKLNLTGFPVGFGVFKEWVKIDNSNDYYMVLSNPFSKSKDTTQLGVRIVVDDTKIASKPANFQKTALNVDDLGYGFKNKKISSSQQFGFFASINQSMLNKIIIPGDVVGVYTFPLNEIQAKAAKNLTLTDEKNIPYAMSVSVRRFGGLSELKNELGQ